jgi:hypothetical protein
LANEFWREDGEATILFAREVAPRRVTMAAFLVDILAMGLKDAWGRTDMSMSDFAETVANLDATLGVAPLDPDTARHLVFGGIELADRLGFRLPRRYERWTAVLGPLPEGDAPNMSLFLPDGKIQLVCSRRDLEARLIGTTPEAFLARPDVESALGLDDFTLVDEEEDQDQEVMGQIEAAMTDAARQWCFARGQAPHPLLPDVIGAVLEAIMQSAAENLDEDDDTLEALPEARQQEIAEQAIAFMVASAGHDPDALEAAAEQAFAFLESAGSPEQLLAAAGLDLSDLD